MSGTAAAVAACAAFAASLPFWAGQGLIFVAGATAIEAVFSLSWNLLFGFTGLASFGHAAFFSMGAYFVAAALKLYPGIPFLLLLPACAGIGGASAALVGLVALRRTGGLQLAILTLALSEVLLILITYSSALGGADGLSAVPRPVIALPFGRIDLARGDAYYWFVLGVCLLLACAMWWLVSGRHGRVLRCIKQDAERAAFLGVDVAASRLAAFTIAGAVAALAGGLSAPWTQIVTPGVGNWVHSTQAILNSLLGGANFFWGPVVGSVVFAGIDYITRTFAGLSEIVIGGILLIVVLGAPGGLLGALARLRARSAAEPVHAPAQAR